MSRLCASCTSVSNPGFTRVTLYLTEGTWQAELSEDITQPETLLLISAIEN